MSHSTLQRENRNTIGNVPLEWYKDEEHIGYDREGNKLIKSKKKDELDKLLERQDDPKVCPCLSNGPIIHSRVLMLKRNQL